MVVVVSVTTLVVIIVVGVILVAVLIGIRVIDIPGHSSEYFFATSHVQLSV